MKSIHRKRLKMAAVLVALLVLMAAVSAYAETPSDLPEVERIDFESLDSAQVADVSTEAELVAALADPDVIAVSLRQDIQLTAPLQVEKDILFRSGTRDTRTIWSAPQADVRHMYLPPAQDITVQFRQVVLDGGEISGGIEREYEEATNVSTIIDPVIQNCRAKEGGAMLTHGDVVISGGIIQDNMAEKGGGIYLLENTKTGPDGCSSVVMDTVVINNTANTTDGTHNSTCYGGGIASRFNGVLIINCIITDNHSAGAGMLEYNNDGGIRFDGIFGGGGGIYMHGSTIIVRDSEIMRNTSSGYGGGIHVDINVEIPRSNLSVYDSKVSNNTAEKNGGGIGYPYDIWVATTTIRKAGAALKLYDTEISENLATGTGDGIYTQGAIEFYGNVVCTRNYENPDWSQIPSFELGVVCKQLHTYSSY